LEVCLFGAVQIHAGDNLLPPFPTQRSRELFAALAANPNYPHPRTTLAGALWPEKSEDKARASLNTELWRVRQVLGKADQYLEQTRETVALNLPPEQVDTHRFRALVRRGDVPSLEKAVELYRGDFLDGCYADWCLLERERLRDLWQGALEGLLRHRESRGEPAEAIAFAKRLHALDPLREDIHRALMRLYAGLGDRPAALAQYQHCKAVLQQELGIPPMPETEALFAKIRQTAPLEDHWLARREATRRITGHRLAELRASKKYLPELYIPRPTLESRMDEFIRSETAGLILVGASGCGKTSFLARLAGKRIEQDDLVLLLDASTLTLDVRHEVTRLLWGAASISAEEALAALGRDAASKNRLVWIILDELSAFHDLGAGPAELLRRLDALVASVHRQSDVRAVKFVLACREHPWRLLALGGAANLNWQCYFNRQPLTIAQYTPEETRLAFDLYREHFKIANPFDDLPEETRERFRTPFFLRLAAETWQGKTIPATGSERRLFQEYFEQVVAGPGARQFIAGFTTRIARQRKAQIPLSGLRADPALQPALDGGPHSPFEQLVEAGVLEIVGSEFSPQLRFTHERLLEYLLARYYETQCAEGTLGEDCLIEMARGSWDFPALWGAALTWLLQNKDPDDFIRLAGSGSTEANHLATEGLAALHQEHPSLAGSFARRLFDLPFLDAKRIALFAASRMGETGLGLFKTASGSRDAATRQIVFVVVNAIYRRDPQLALAILHHLLDDIGLQTILTAPERLQLSLRILSLFTRYGLPKNLMDEADGLIHTVAVKNLRLPDENNKLGRSLVQRLLSANTTSWPADRNAVETVVRSGSLTGPERAAFSRVLASLKLREGGLDTVSQEDLSLLLVSPSDAVQILVHHQLCLWLNLRQEQALSVIQSLFDSTDIPSTRLWLLMAFQPLNAPGIERFQGDSLQALENLTARFAEENRGLFIEGASNGTLGLIGPIGFFPLGMRYARAQKFDFPLLSAYAASDPAGAAQYLRLLSPVGWFHPQEVLAVFEHKVDFRKPLHPQVLESLGLLWVSHPEVVDHFLRYVGASEVMQRQIHTSVDIEQTLRAINLIHNTDLRVSSILLGAPYGRWVTDSVFQGYVASQSLDEAASRFGQGLVEVYMQSGWRLKRILGLEK